MITNSGIIMILTQRDVGVVVARSRRERSEKAFRGNTFGRGNLAGLNRPQKVSIDQ